jgi:hypothetical protein
MTQSPSPAYGLRRVGEFWRVVLAVWIVSAAVFVPARIIVWAAAGPTFFALPGGDLADGERALIAIELLRPVWAPLAVAVLSAWIALWVWTVLWHAGVVRWLLLSGRTELRLAEVVGHGLIGWWRWARLGLTTAAVLLVTHSFLWLIVEKARDQAAATGDDGLLGFVVPAVFVASICVVVSCWLATLRGAWLLGAIDRRSAVLAWLAGFWGTARQPISSLFTLAVWGLPAISAVVIPVVAGWRVEALRGIFPTAVIEAAAGMLTAFCLVGLFLSFVPITGQAETER